MLVRPIVRSFVLVIASLKLLDGGKSLVSASLCFSSCPRLTGRAVVEFTMLKADGSLFAIKNGAETTTTGVMQVMKAWWLSPGVLNFAMQSLAGSETLTSIMLASC